MFKSIKTAEELEAERVARELAKQVQEKKKYLSETDYKMTVDYFTTLTEEEQVELTSLRAEAREFIRINEDTTTTK